MPASPLAGMRDAHQGEGNGYNTTRWKMCVRVCIARTLCRGVNREEVPFNKAPPVRRGQGWAPRSPGTLSLLGLAGSWHELINPSIAEEAQRTLI